MTAAVRRTTLVLRGSKFRNINIQFISRRLRLLRLRLRLQLVQILFLPRSFILVEIIFEDLNRLEFLC